MTPLLCCIASLCLPWLATYLFLARSVAIDNGTPHGMRLLRASLAVGLGLGLSSCSYFLWINGFGATGRSAWAAEIALWGGAAILAWLFRLPQQRQAAQECHSFEWTTDARNIAPDSHIAAPQLRQKRFPLPLRWNQALLGVFAIACLLTLLGTIGHSIDEPLGGWDAWAFWNQRPRFLFRVSEDWATGSWATGNWATGNWATENRGAPTWQDAFSPAFSHVDYPLCIPLSTLRCWVALGDDPAWVPCLIGLAFLFATLGLLVGGVTRFRGQSQGLLAGLVLMGTIRFLRTGASQYADVPLAFFVLATLMLLLTHDFQGKRHSGCLYLAGLSAGLAAWTKNEGLLFVMVVLVSRAAATWSTDRGTKAAGDAFRMGMGALPVLLVVAVFKAGVPAANDLVAGQDLDATIDRLFDGSRYLAIARSFISSTFTVAKPLAVVLPIAALLLGRSPVWTNETTGRRTILLVLALMLAGYAATYLSTPHNLEWHLSTSFDRLILQIWPVGLLAYFLSVATPEEALVSREPYAAEALPRIAA